VSFGLLLIRDNLINHKLIVTRGRNSNKLMIKRIWIRFRIKINVLELEMGLSSQYSGQSSYASYSVHYIL
jgi:hypothetical protein